MHCGIMVNYQCTAACQHCLYASSPAWQDGYITEATMRDVCQMLRKYGCTSIHIGGGEPFMDFEGLCMVARMARDHGITIEYVETNAYWATDEATIRDRLRQLRHVGIDAFCISNDAYHAEFIDPALPKRLAAVCQREGFGHFMWQTRLNGLRFNGRATQLEEAHFPKKPIAALLKEAEARGGCRKLLSTNHFHVDMHGQFIPPGCTGFVLPLEDALNGTLHNHANRYLSDRHEDTAMRYPAFVSLYNGGAAALYNTARQHGFAPDEEDYPSVCNLCFHMRRYLSTHHGFAELDEEHFRHAR